MGVVTTALTRSSRRERHRKKALISTSHRTLLCLAAVSLLLITQFVTSPRVVLGSTIMGVDVGGLLPAQAARALAAAFQSEVPLGLELPTGQLFVTRSELGFIPDFEATVNSASRRVWWDGSRISELKGRFDNEKLMALIQKIEAGLPTPKDARIIAQGDRVRIEPSVTGLVVDVDALKQQIVLCLERATASLKVPLKEVVPRLTTVEAESFGLTRMLASYTTHYPMDNTRSENIRIASSILSGIILAPGEVLSFNQQVGPREPSRGYKEASVFFADRIEKGYGGGVCQVSTTLYNAAILANLDIVERHPHSMAVDYVPLGRDAAVAYGEIDLIFRNSTPNHVLITAETGPGQLTFRVFGENLVHGIQIETKQLSRTEFQTETILDPTLPSGKTVVTPGKNGYRVVTYKVLTSSDGNVTRTLLNYSTYLPMKQIVREGTGT